MPSDGDNEGYLKVADVAWLSSAGIYAQVDLPQIYCFTFLLHVIIYMLHVEYPNSI